MHAMRSITIASTYYSFALCLPTGGLVEAVGQERALEILYMTEDLEDSGGVMTLVSWLSLYKAAFKPERKFVHPKILSQIMGWQLCSRLFSPSVFFP